MKGDKMFDMKIDEGVDPEALAYISIEDLKQGKTVFYIGGGPCPRRWSVWGTEKEIIENFETVVTHESAHLAIYKITNSINITDRMDRIDTGLRGWPISRGFE